MRIQSEEDFYNDLIVLTSLIPKGKPIIFQTHFRPNIIYNDPSMAIEYREIIYNNIDKFCNENENTYLYDPSIIIQQDHTLFDGDVHFNNNGHNINFDILIILMKKYIKSIDN
jgi:hypothetical protein